MTWLEDILNTLFLKTKKYVGPKLYQIDPKRLRAESGVHQIWIKDLSNSRDIQVYLTNGSNKIQRFQITLGSRDFIEWKQGRFTAYFGHTINAVVGYDWKPAPEVPASEIIKLIEYFSTLDKETYPIISQLESLTKAALTEGP